MSETRTRSRRNRRTPPSSLDQSSSSNIPAASANGNGNNNKTVSPLQHNSGANNSMASGSQRGNGRRRHRRAGKGGEKHRRKWKPYDKLSWEEKRLLGEKEAITAEKRREDALRQGHPVAPFNTTQFIMEEHSGGKGITPRMVANRSLSASGNQGSGSGAGSGFCSQQDTPLREEMGDDNDVYFEREYHAALETVRTERLQAMNSQQLRDEVLRLEVEIDTINKNNQMVVEGKDNEIAELRKEVSRQRDLLAKCAELAKSDIAPKPTASSTNHAERVTRRNSVDQDDVMKPLSPNAS